MKNCVFPWIGMGLLSLTLTMGALGQHATAQDVTTRPVATNNGDEDLGWGLLGLIGLLGLGGLFRGDRHDATNRDSNVTATSRNVRT